MHWTEITAPPSTRTLRQFAGLFLVVFGSMATYRAFRGDTGALTLMIGSAAAVIGLAGLIWPPSVRYLYTGWMIAAFPIGWTVSRIIIAVMFYLMITPIALVFRIIGRDALRLRRRSEPTYWTPTESGGEPESYYSQY